MKKYLMALIVFNLTGCVTSVGIEGAQQIEVMNTKLYSESFDDIWGDSVEWFAVNNIPIEKMDKSSGLLTSKYTLGANQSLIDCGQPVGNIGLYKAKFNGLYANITVMVRERSEKIRATINVFGRAHVTLRNGYGLVGESYENCFSKGELEKGFHNFLGGI